MAPPRHARRLGRWELLEPVGVGRWSTVFRARPRDCPADWPADYAVKVAQAAGREAQHAQALLTREAMIGRTVIHPHLIAVLSAQVETAPYYLVMPLLDGATLRKALDACGPFETPQALWLVRQIAESLVTLHEAGWIHADIKPDNIQVSPQGHGTLIDLGFALRLGSAECEPGATLRGTITYTAPEMISSALPIDQQADIYSLGITLYELLAGQPPFLEEDPGRLMLAHLQRPMPELRRRLPGLPREVQDLLRSMLAKEPLRRPTAAELVRQLVRLEIATLDQRATDDSLACSGNHVGQLVHDQVGDIQRGRGSW